MYHVSTQGVDERMMNVHYYYYYSCVGPMFSLLVFCNNFQCWYCWSLGVKLYQKFRYISGTVRVTMRTQLSVWSFGISASRYSIHRDLVPTTLTCKRDDKNNKAKVCWWEWGGLIWKLLFSRSFTCIETIRLIRDGWPPQLSHRSRTL